MSVTLKTLKNSAITFKNMDPHTVSLEPDVINTYKKKVKADYNNLIEDWEKVRKAAKTASDHKDTQGDYKKVLDTLESKASKRKSASVLRRDQVVARIDKDVDAYADAILGQKIKELEQRIAELTQALNEK